MLGDAPCEEELRKLVRIASAQSAHDPPRSTCSRLENGIREFAQRLLTRAACVMGRVIVVDAPLPDATRHAEETVVVRGECS
jgi:hypothetical protein